MLTNKPTAWTDYPFIELGDISGKKAPIREVELLSYDQDKYVRVRFEGITKTIKAGYLYLEPGRVGEATPVGHRRLCDWLPSQT